MNKIKQPESGVLGSKPSSLVTNLGGAALLAITTGFAGKTEAATLDTPTFDTPTLIAGADTSADELSPGVDPATGDIAFVVPDGSDYNLTILPAGSSTASTVSGMNDAWNPIHIDSDNKYILSGGGNNVYQATTTDSWGSASASELYSDAAYNIDGDVALDPDADPASLNTGEFLKTYTNPTTRTTEITDLFDESYVVAEDTGHQMNPAFASNGRLLYMNDGYAYFKDLNGVYDDVAAPDLDGCVTWAYDTLNNDVICSDGTDLYRFHETTYDSTTTDADGDGEDSTVDCDDTNADINSSADEECDGVDNNCDGSIDGMDSIDVSTWYRDADSDGVGGTTTQEACDAPSGYVATGGDWDDNDASVQTEPVAEDECDGEESAGGEFESGELVCGPEGMAVVWSGAVDYDDSLAMTYMEDAQDWLEFQDALPMDSSTYNGLVITPTVGSRGGYALAITDAEMTAFLGAPPPSSGAQPATLRVDDGEDVLVDNLIQGTSEYLGQGTYDYLEEGVVDADGDGVYDNVYNNPDAFPNDANESEDSDGDGQGNNGDLDDDNDGYSDSEEAAAGTDPEDDSSYPSGPDDTAGDDTATDTDDSAGDTDEPETDDTAADWEVPGDGPGGCSCSAMTDLSPFSGPMPWVAIGVGLSAVVGRRKR